MLIQQPHLAELKGRSAKPAKLLPQQFHSQRMSLRWFKRPT